MSAAAGLADGEPVFVERGQVLLAAFVAWGGAAACLVPGNPFPLGFCLIALFSALMHTGLFLAYSRLKQRHYVQVNVANLLMLPGIIHFTGGVSSPFLLLFPCILISGAGYGVLPRHAVPLTMLSYASVVILEAAGLLTPVDFDANVIYAHPTVVAMIVFASMAFIYISGTIYEVTVERLRGQVRTEQGRAQERLLRMSRMEAHSQLGVTVAKIAHDIRGPVGAVDNFFETVGVEKHLDEEERRDCRLIRAELKRINGLIDRMLHYVRPGAGPRERIDLAPLLEDVVSLARFLPGGWRVECETRLPEPGCCVVEGEKGQLQQVFFNLVKNAVEALRDRERPLRLSVELSRRGELVETLVCDNGPGFPAAAVSSLGNDPYTEKKDGGGLGLVIVREIVDAHGGTVVFSNRPQGGAQTRVRLPAAGAAGELRP